MTADRPLAADCVAPSLKPRCVRVFVAPADIADWAALLVLLRDSFAYMAARIDPPSSLRQMGIGELRAKAASESLIVAVDEAGLAGCAFAALKPDCVYVGKLAVAERVRGRGVARRIVGVAESIARDNGRQFLELRTRIELVENHRAFVALGFEKVAETAHPGYRRPTSITMRKRLTVRVA